MKKIKIAVIGLGYVGLPLALEFGKKFKTIGFDVLKERVNELKQGMDRTKECTKEEIKKAKLLTFSNQSKDLSYSNFFIVTVPTPINSSKNPDLKALKRSCEMLGLLIKNGDFIVFESTVFPGATEEICIPLIEKKSKLKLNVDFFVGYSPERINPGDKNHRITDICKITSGSNTWAATQIDKIYSKIITAGTFQAASIKVAEAAKVIENVQRDLNIALINELAQIFASMKIDTTDVLSAASTKWNFTNYKPGLVGGHCIGVDPYYLTHKAQELDLYPELVLAGRRTNEGMPKYLASQIIKLMVTEAISLVNAKILILGITFKANCNDIRNTKVPVLIKEIKNFGSKVDVFDPLVDQKRLKNEYGLDMSSPEPYNYDVIVLAVPHQNFIKQGSKNLRKYGKSKHLLIDPWSAFSAKESDFRV